MSKIQTDLLCLLVPRYYRYHWEIRCPSTLTPIMTSINHPSNTPCKYRILLISPKESHFLFALKKFSRINYLALLPIANYSLPQTKLWYIHYAQQQQRTERNGKSSICKEKNRFYLYPSFCKLRFHFFCVRCLNFLPTELESSQIPKDGSEKSLSSVRLLPFFR